MKTRAEWQLEQFKKGNYKFERVVAAWDIPGFKKPVSYEMSRGYIALWNWKIKRNYPEARLMCIVRQKRVVDTQKPQA